jgi:hypothetical protein
MCLGSLMISHFLSRDQWFSLLPNSRVPDPLWTNPAGPLNCPRNLSVPIGVRECTIQEGPAAVLLQSVHAKHKLSQSKTHTFYNYFVLIAASPTEFFNPNKNHHNVR